MGSTSNHFSAPSSAGNTVNSTKVLSHIDFNNSDVSFPPAHPSILICPHQGRQFCSPGWSWLSIGILLLLWLLEPKDLLLGGSLQPSINSWLISQNAPCFSPVAAVEREKNWRSHCPMVEHIWHALALKFNPSHQQLKFLRWQVMGRKGMVREVSGEPLPIRVDSIVLNGSSLNYRSISHIPTHQSTKYKLCLLNNIQISNELKMPSHFRLEYKLGFYAWKTLSCQLVEMTSSRILPSTTYPFIIVVVMIVIINVCTAKEGNGHCQDVGKSWRHLSHRKKKTFCLPP